jgi:hypothetical protein
VHVRLAERGLANSRIGFLVPSGGRAPSLAARLAIDHIRAHFIQFSRELSGPAEERSAKTTGERRTPLSRRAARR